MTTLDLHRLEEHPELLGSWYAFCDARALRRAAEWLVDESLVDQAETDRFLAAHPGPPLP